MLHFYGVIRSVQDWNRVGFSLPFPCLPADGRNLSPHGAQTDGKMLVFRFQSSVLILLSSECISQTDYACQAICNMCHDSLFFFFLTLLKIFSVNWHCLHSISLRRKMLYSWTKWLPKCLWNFDGFKVLFLLFLWSNSTTKKYIFKYNWGFL